ncbi:hypothetical protein LJR015_003928 [Peribacillus frigoritolerans]|uniref:hypothetical protein n=1 Tax=Peribacillus frigoritolerans TaxID=450367 RepID=UPI003ECE4849
MTMRKVPKRQTWKSSRLFRGIDFEREIKAAMRIGRVFKLGDAVIITDQDQRILNAYYEQTKGYSRNSFIGFKVGFLKSGLTPLCTYTSLKNELRMGKP